MSLILIAITFKLFLAVVCSSREDVFTRVALMLTENQNKCETA